MVAGLDKRGALLVFGAAAVWSFGGAIARYLTVSDSWTIIFWRSVCAAAFLLGFMLWRNGPRGTRALFASMGFAGIGVGMCFATASILFVVALRYTTVANILLMQAGAPLFAALLTFLFFGERISNATWVAIAAVMGGVGIMVSDALAGRISPMGDGLAIIMSIAFASAAVLTRRHANVGMMPAVFLGTVIAVAISGSQATDLHVSLRDAGLLFVFGALNLALGMVLFVTGVRLLPAAIAALISTAEPVLGPVWVWLVHKEIPNSRTLVGGAVVVVALLLHIGWQFRQQQQVASVPLAD